MLTTILGLLYFTLPILIIYFTVKSKFVNKIGAVIIAYAIGLLLGHIGIIPRPNEFLLHAIQSGLSITDKQLELWLSEGAINLKDINAYKVYKLQDVVTSITIPIALPLLLFSLRIKVWFRMSGKTMLSMVLAIAASLCTIITGYFIFGEEIHYPKKIAGMLVGLYTGGTPNLASLKEMLGVDANTYIITHTYDTVVSVIYLLFIITIGKVIFRSFLLPYPRKRQNDEYDLINLDDNPYKGFFLRQYRKGLILAFLLSALVFAISGGIALLAPPSSLMLVVILVITTLSILLSFIPKVNTIDKSFELGMYFIIVFSLVVATMADLGKLITISGSLFMYISMVVFGTLTLHALLCKVFKVDADTFMVSSTALICSPPFVPMVAGPLGNKEVIVSGLTVGIMGYAIGNYIGVSLAAIL